MKIENLTTDELVKMIILETRSPLPTYDYENYRKFISVIPFNQRIGNSRIGIEKADMHDTFREGCIRIIRFYENNIKNK